MSALQIISYHYVRDLQNSKFPKIKGLDTKIFQQQLDYLQSEFHVVTTEQVIASLMTGIDLPDGATWLTFDDGFIDHYEVVFPELLSRGLTAAFFPPAQPILEHVVLDVHKIHFIIASTEPEQLHKLLEVLFAGKDLERKTGKSFNEYFLEYGVPGQFDGPLPAFAKRMLQFALPESDRKLLINQLFNQVVTSDEDAFARILYLTTSQIKEMIAGGMFFGSHGFRHHHLDRESVEDQLADIQLGLQFLGEVGASTREWVMCYPYGSYNDATLSILKQTNCALAITVKSATAQVGSDSRYELPRLDTNDLLPGQRLWLTHQVGANDHHEHSNH
jgi:peptidoglycan/xylan/chitin deacetylase (PgdA/CDA1 family)